MSNKMSLLQKLNLLMGQYRLTSLKTLAVIVTILIVAAQISPEVQKYIITNGILTYIVLIVLLDLTILIENKVIYSAVEVLTNQDESMDTLISNVANTKQIELLEYAAATTLPLIRAIHKHNVPVKILIKHPETVDGLQRQRTITTLDTLYNAVFNEGCKNFEIKCYKLPYTLRARLFHEKLLELGWLTPNLPHQTAHGSYNPLVLFDLRRDRNDHAQQFFKRTFNDYWCHSETEDGAVVLERLSVTTEKAH